MFQLFLRARAHNFLKSRLSGYEFRVRSADRDAETDRARISSIMSAIESVLQAAEDEQSGFNLRVQDALARAAVTLGNGTDEYVDREPLDNHHQNLFTYEITNGQRRLDELAAMISHLRFIKVAMLTRFPDFKPSPSSTGARK